MKRLFKTYLVYSVWPVVLLSRLFPAAPDTAPVQEPVQDGAVEEAPASRLSHPSRADFDESDRPLLSAAGNYVAYRVKVARYMPWAWGSPASSLKPPMPVRWGRTQETARIILSQSQTIQRSGDHTCEKT